VTTIRIAHYSDIHVTVPPWQQPWSSLLNKRLAGLFSYTLGGRGRRFSGVEGRITALLEDVDAQRVDHALCTGDLTAISLREEFSRCAALFGHRLHEPQKLTVIPGNHDRYVQQAVDERFFEEHFASVSSGNGFPFQKTLAPGVVLVALDVARPTPFHHSSGLCGEAQRARLLELLTDPSLRNTFVILALHYGLLRANGARDRASHGLRDDEALLELLDRQDVQLDLVVHGHMHNAFEVRSKRRLIHCAGSATDLHVACGYNVYTVDLERRRVTSSRRVWDIAARSYVPAVITAQ